jgi:hypothetical protein
VTVQGHSLEQRYGAAPPWRRPLLLGAVALVVVALLALWGWITVFQSDPPVSSVEIGHAVVDDHTATVEFRITYGDGPVEASCRARAVAADKSIVGELVVEPDPDEGPVHEIEISTERRATTVEWIGCTAEGQPRPR